LISQVFIKHATTCTTNSAWCQLIKFSSILQHRFQHPTLPARSPRVERQQADSSHFGRSGGANVHAHGEHSCLQFLWEVMLMGPISVDGETLLTTLQGEKCPSQSATTQQHLGHATGVGLRSGAQG